MNIIGESKIIENITNRRQEQKTKSKEDGRVTTE